MVFFSPFPLLPSFAFIPTRRVLINFYFSQSWTSEIKTVATTLYEHNQRNFEFANTPLFSRLRNDTRRVSYYSACIRAVYESLLHGENGLDVGISTYFSNFFSTFQLNLGPFCSPRYIFLVSTKTLMSAFACLANINEA